METFIQLLSLIVSFLCSIFILFKITRKMLVPNLTPGPLKLPLVGNLHNLVGNRPHRALHRLSLKYGPLMRLHLGEHLVVVVSSPDCAKQVMKTQGINFASRPSITASEIITYGCPALIFRPYDDYWRQTRKIITSELLSPKRIQCFRSMREQVFYELTKWIASNERSPVNLTDTIFSSTDAFIAQATLGEKGMKEKIKLIETVKEAITLATGFNIAELYPSVKLIQKLGAASKRLRELHLEADEILESIIHDHKVAKKSAKIHEGGEVQQDLIDVLLKYQDNELQDSFTNNNIKAIIVEVLSAGSDTSATTLDWVMVEMMKNPQVLNKAKDEVRQVFDQMGFVDESHIHQLNYLKSAIKETLRLHAPIPLLLPRKCDKSSEINGYVIPSDAKVVINSWAINRDPKYWEDPLCFRPERFLNSSVDHRGQHFEYIPFGAGRRMCPGMSFGLANVELTLAMFLYHFDWNLPNGIEHQDLDMSEEFGVTTRRKMDLLVVPAVKRPLPVGDKVCPPI